jgi:YggT family protein
MSFLNYIPNLVNGFFYIFQILLIIYILMSWIPQAKLSPIGQFIGKIVEPYLNIFRRFIPPIGMIDLSPIVAIIALRFVQQGLLVVIIWILSLFGAL